LDTYYPKAYQTIRRCPSPDIFLTTGRMNDDIKSISKNVDSLVKRATEALSGTSNSCH